MMNRPVSWYDADKLCFLLTWRDADGIVGFGEPRVRISCVLTWWFLCKYGGIIQPFCIDKKRILQRSIFAFLPLDSNPLNYVSPWVGNAISQIDYIVKTKSNKANFHHDSSTGKFSQKKWYFMSSDDLIDLLERYTAIRDHLKRHKGPVRMLFFSHEAGVPKQPLMSSFKIQHFWASFISSLNFPLDLLIQDRYCGW